MQQSRTRRPDRRMQGPPGTPSRRLDPSDDRATLTAPTSAICLPFGASGGVAPSRLRGAGSRPDADVVVGLPAGPAAEGSGRCDQFAARGELGILQSMVAMVTKRCRSMATELCRELPHIAPPVTPGSLDERRPVVAHRRHHHRPGDDGPACERGDRACPFSTASVHSRPARANSTRRSGSSPRRVARRGTGVRASPKVVCVLQASPSGHRTHCCTHDPTGRQSRTFRPYRPVPLVTDTSVRPGGVLDRFAHGVAHLKCAMNAPWHRIPRGVSETSRPPTRGREGGI